MAKVIAKGQLSAKQYEAFINAPKFGRAATGSRGLLRKFFDDSPIKSHLDIFLAKKEAVPTTSHLPYKLKYRTLEVMSDGSKNVRFVKVA
jgi:hypothetical protein